MNQDSTERIVAGLRAWIATAPPGARVPSNRALTAEHGARLLRNYLSVMTLELQTMARACGKNHVLNLEPEDLVALTVEAAAMAGVPLAGTNWIPGRGAY